MVLEREVRCRGEECYGLAFQIYIGGIALQNARVKRKSVCNVCIECAVRAFRVKYLGYCWTFFGTAFEFCGTKVEVRALKEGEYDKGCIEKCVLILTFCIGEDRIERRCVLTIG